VFFCTDSEAWHELARIYLKLHMYDNAACCYEELILAEPQNYHFYVKYAEIKYTAGGLENLRIALNYYSTAIELCKENNLAAFYGLLLTMDAISSKDSNNSILNESTSIAVWAKKHILEQYTSSPSLKLVAESLELLQNSNFSSKSQKAVVKEEKKPQQNVDVKKIVGKNIKQKKK